jgi:hypothetical protein
MRFRVVHVTGIVVAGSSGFPILFRFDAFPDGDATVGDTPLDSGLT